MKMRADSSQCNHLNPATLATSRLRPHGNPDVLAKCGEQPHEPLAGEVAQPAVEQGRNLGLVDPHYCSRVDLGQTFPLNHLADQARELGLAQFFVGLGKPQVGEDVAAAADYGDGLCSL